MTLAQHLVELRRRLTIAVIGLVAGMIIAFLVSDVVIDLIAQPIEIIAQERGRDFVELNFDTVTSGFDLRMRIAFAIGLLISAPVWLWQIWAFVMPGLTRKEVNYTIWFMVAAVPLFFAGCTVGWFIVPHVIELMAGFVPDTAASFYKYDYYYDFVFKMLLVIGVAFVLPVFLVALNLAGIMSGRGILKGWRVAVLVATTFAALATPAADVVSMLLLAGIMIVLYVAAAGVSLLFDRRRSKREAALLADGSG
ncbi:twin-arginine translocase subunit TatC [Microbacterium sp. LRZ72]|uniref:twin-arginine translocase subunit TatC n=1 Tax=Microbacterium sp. LRZ72 TaxID=2942481 RepID=UPI0029A9E2E6|nr:twin-arginine translocase subunit TatC [Microbacterium sp. LRZ72]MDX2375309.1 twin-arginine translocase subunit TatC [Microbacterium sp. LRZ72]